MTEDEEASIARDLLARLNEGKAKLLVEMARHGLTSEHGWRIGEGLRSHPTGHEFVLYPMHSHRDFAGLEVTVRIGGDGRPIGIAQDSGTFEHS